MLGITSFYKLLSPVRRVEELIRKEKKFTTSDYVFYAVWSIGLLILIYTSIYGGRPIALDLAIGILYGLFLGLREELRGQRTMLTILLKLRLKKSRA